MYHEDVPLNKANTVYYMRHRYYDAAQRRFISPDPLGIDDLLEREEILNLFAYARDNPLWFSDPLGLWQVTIGGGYGYAGRITFGKNNGRWNIGGGFGFGIGLMGEFTAEDRAPAFASEGNAVNIGVEVSGSAKLWTLLDVSGGLRGRAEADECQNVETRVGAIGGLKLPGTIVNVHGSADLVFQANTTQATFDAFPELSPKPVSFGFGGMVFGGVTGGVSWEGGPSK